MKTVLILAWIGLLLIGTASAVLIFAGIAPDGPVQFPLIERHRQALP